MLWSLPLFIGISCAASSCNPLSTTGCPNDPALATSTQYDFKSEASLFTTVSTPTGISYSDEGLKLTLAKRLDNPAIRSSYYIMFGRVEVSLKAANGTGIISTVFLESDDLDEIDIELFGGDKTQFQSNYFSKGNTSTYDRGEYHTTSGVPQNDYHNYTIDWTSDRLQWWLDGELVRTLSSDSSSGYPQTPMRVAINIWAGGDSSNAEGTIEWAGGSTTYDEDYYMYVNYLSVEDYSTGDSYHYSDTSGSWESIKAVNGEVSGNSDSDISGTSSTSSTTTATDSSSLPDSESTLNPSNSESSTDVATTADFGSQETALSGESTDSIAGTTVDSILGVETTASNTQTTSLATTSVNSISNGTLTHTKASTANSASSLTIGWVAMVLAALFV